MLGESIIITSNAAGTVNAFYNVCRHRGTKLCTDAEGSFAGSIQCPYHAWTYDLDGALIGAPHMDEVPHFEKADYPLHRVHADVWDGHIFINLSRERRRRCASSSPTCRPSSRRGGCRISGSATASSTT